MNKNTIRTKVLRELQNNRLRAEFLAAENLKKARSQSPEFMEIDNRWNALVLECAKATLNSEHYKKTRLELAKTEEKRSKQLEKIGMNIEDITPKYSCKKCKDTGFLQGQMCTCLRQSINQKMLELGGLSAFEGHSFSQVDTALLEENPVLKKAHELAKTYVAKFPDVKTPNLVFMGEVGIGKTFLLECIANALLEKDFFVVYVTAFGLSNAMLKSLTVAPLEREALLSPLLECDLLIIDDLGSEPMFRNLSTTNLFTIFNEREVKNKATMLSTNLSLAEIEERYGNRLFSRIFNKRRSNVVRFQGKDLRIK